MNYLSAVIKAVKSSPTPPPSLHTHERWGDLHPRQSQIWDLDISLWRSSTWILQWMWWGKAQQGPGCVGQLFMICCCAAVPQHLLASLCRDPTTETGQPWDTGPLLATALLPLPTHMGENQWKRAFIGTATKTCIYCVEEQFLTCPCSTEGSLHDRIPLSGLSLGCSRIPEQRMLPADKGGRISMWQHCSLLLPGHSLSHRTWSWTAAFFVAPSSIYISHEEKFIWEWWGWQRLLTYLFPQSCVHPAVLSHPKKCPARWELLS